MSTVRDRVDAYLAAHEDDLLELTRQLIAVDSQIPPYADEREIVSFVSGVLADAGFTEQEVVAATPERPSLVTRIRGAGGGRNLMLNGHLDTKPVGEAADQWHTDPFTATIVDGDLFGLGSNDMKGAVAAMIWAARALIECGVPLRGDLVLGFVADEEGGAQYGAKHLAPVLRDVDAVLIGEPSGWSQDWQGIHLVSRGVCGFRVTVTGTQMHSSLSDRMPSVNASLKMADLMLRMADQLDLPFIPHRLGGVGPTLNRGVMLGGGTFFGVVPGRAEFACDLRTVPGMTREGVVAALEEWVARAQAADPDLHVEVALEPGLDWIPWSELDADHPLATATAAAAADVLGAAPPFSVFPGGTDAPWFSGAGIPTLPSFGPGMLTSAHGPNEFVSVRSLLEAARIYARVAADFCS
ncbi:MAG: M20 family metallopeptidase [Actinomycetota bacterium]